MKNVLLCLISLTVSFSAFAQFYFEDDQKACRMALISQGEAERLKYYAKFREMKYKKNKVQDKLKEYESKLNKIYKKYKKAEYSELNEYLRDYRSKTTSYDFKTQKKEIAKYEKNIKQIKNK